MSGYTALALGADSTPAAQRPEFAPFLQLSPTPTVGMSVRLMEEAYTAMEAAETMAAQHGPFEFGPSFTSTYANIKAKITQQANKLRGMNYSAHLSTSEWATTRDLFFEALNTYAGASEGRSYDDTLADQFLEDVKTNLKNIPKDALSDLGKMPWWVWVVIAAAGGGVLLYFSAPFLIPIIMRRNSR